jgi:hypothetical protein
MTNDEIRELIQQYNNLGDKMMNSITSALALKIQNVRATQKINSLGDLCVHFNEVEEYKECEKLQKEIGTKLNALDLSLDAKDPSKEIRVVVASFTNDNDLLKIMSEDKEVDVRYQVACRIDKDSASMMWMLDADERVRKAAMENVCGTLRR